MKEKKNNLTKTAVGKEVYVVIEDWKARDDDAKEIKGIYTTIEGAKARMRECIEEMLADWGDKFNYPNEDEEGKEINPFEEGYLDEDEEWEVEVCRDTCYTLSNYESEYYYNVIIDIITLEE